MIPAGHTRQPGEAGGGDGDPDHLPVAGGPHGPPEAGRPGQQPPWVQGVGEFRVLPEAAGLGRDHHQLASQWGRQAGPFDHQGHLIVFGEIAQFDLAGETALQRRVQRFHRVLTTQVPGREKDQVLDRADDHLGRGRDGQQVKVPAQAGRWQLGSRGEHQRRGRIERPDQHVELLAPATGDLVEKDRDLFPLRVPPGGH